MVKNLEVISRTPIVYYVYGLFDLQLIYGVYRLGIFTMSAIESLKITCRLQLETIFQSFIK